jgi:NAD(P)H-dependent FMN reductase
MKICIISSSTRPGRNSHRVALALSELIRSHQKEVTLIDLLETPLPFFKERYALLEEADRTENMHYISQKLIESTGIIFVTPEYNGNSAPALINLMDTFGRAEFGAKPIGVATVSTGVLGGMRAAQQLQQNILYIQGYPQPQLLLTGEVTKQLDEKGVILNAEYQQKIENFVNAYLKFAQRFV